MSSLPYALHPISSSLLPFFLVCGSLITLTIAVRRVLIAWLPNVHGWHVCIISLSLVLTWLLHTTGKSELRYWVSGNVSYLTGAALIIELTSGCVAPPPQKRWMGWECVWTAMVSLHKLNIAIVGVGIAAVSAIRASSSRTPREHVVLGSLIAVGLSLNVLAPGNVLRLAENTVALMPSEAWTLLQIIGFNVWHVAFRFVLEASIGVIALMAIVHTTYQDSGISRWRALVCVWLGILVVDSVVMRVAFANPGPARAHILLEWATLALMCGVGLATFAWLAAPRRIVAAVAICGLCVGASAESREVWRIEAARVYKQAYTRRIIDARLQCQQRAVQIRVATLPANSGLHTMLSNNPDWLSNVYLPYWGCPKGVSISLR